MRPFAGFTRPAIVRSVALAGAVRADEGDYLRSGTSKVMPLTASMPP